MKASAWPCRYHAGAAVAIAAGCPSLRLILRSMQATAPQPHPEAEERPGASARVHPRGGATERPGALSADDVAVSYLGCRPEALALGIRVRVMYSELELSDHTWTVPGR